MIWNFISWVLVIGVVVAIFQADKLPAVKKFLDNFFKEKKKKK